MVITCSKLASQERDRTKVRGSRLSLEPEPSELWGLVAFLCELSHLWLLFLGFISGAMLLILV